MKYLIPIIALATMPVFFFIAYADTERCFDGRMIQLHIIHLDDVIRCLDDRIDNAEDRITVLESAGGGDLTTASNLGSVGEGIFASEVGNDLQFKKLVNGTNITLSSNGTRIMINASGGSDDTVCANVGSGSQVYKDGECNFRTFIGSSDISVTQQTNTVTIDFNGTTGGIIFQSAGEIFQSVTKTNIGTTYTDIYIVAFDQENKMIVNCGNVTKIEITYLWDYVGTGTQQLRWVDSLNNANVFYESPTFTTDRDFADSGFVDKPSWCTSSVILEWQGKSTVAGDDPVAKGYKIQIG